MASAESHSRSFFPNTIRGKLLFVFSVIVLAAAVSAVIAQRANILVQQQLSAITEDNLPTLVIAQEVSEAMTNIRSVAAAMAGAQSEAALASRSALLARHIASARTVVDELGKTEFDRDTAARLGNLIAEVDELATALAATVETRLQVDRQLGESIQALAKEHSTFNSSIAPLISERLAFLGAESERVTERSEASVSQLNDISFKGLIPILSINLQLANMEESLRSALDAESDDMIDTKWGEFVRASSIVSRNLDEIRDVPAIGAIGELDRLEAGFQRITSFGIGDHSLFEKRRAQLGDRRGDETDAAKTLSDLETSFRNFERQLKLSITLIRGETVNVGIDLNRQVSESLAAINQASVDGYGALLKLEALGNRAVGLLSVAPFVDDLNALRPLEAEFEEARAQVESVLDRLGTGDNVSAVAERARHLVLLGLGETSVFALRTSELRALERADDLLFQTNALTQRMSSIAADIVSNARERTDSAAAKVLRSLESSRLTLSLVIAVSLLTMLGAIVYVNRSLGSRLSAFSNAALALAEGDLRVKLPEPSARDEISRLMRALSIFRDTAVEMEESNLREIAQARQRLIDAIESISEGFSLYDADDRLVVANDHYRRMLYPGIEHVVVPGATFETIIRNAIERGLIPEARQDVEAWVADRLARHQNPSDTYIQERSNGRWIQITERRTAEGGTVAVYADITEQKDYEARIIQARDAAEAALTDLQMAQQRLIQAEKMASLGQLTAGIAHEIKNPLNFVNNFAKLSDEMVGELAEILEAPLGALDGETRDESEDLLRTVRENLAKIVEHGRRADSIVKNMLMHAREGPSERQTAKLNAIVDEALNLAYHGARAEHPGFNIEMRKALDPEAGEIECFPQDLMRVFLNLISNGMYAAEKRRADAGEHFLPTIAVATRADGEQVEIEVCDNGVGIPAEDLDRIFTPFFTTKPAGEGTGLGLSLSYDIVVKQHGGDIEVESEPGASATFRVTLPRRLAATA